MKRLCGIKHMCENLAMIGMLACPLSGMTADDPERALFNAAADNAANKISPLLRQIAIDEAKLTEIALPNDLFDSILPAETMAQLPTGLAIFNNDPERKLLGPSEMQYTGQIIIKTDPASRSRTTVNIGPNTAPAVTGNLGIVNENAIRFHKGVAVAFGEYHSYLNVVSQLAQAPASGGQGKVEALRAWDELLAYKLMPAIKHTGIDNDITKVHGITLAEEVMYPRAKARFIIALMKAAPGAAKQLAGDPALLKQFALSLNENAGASVMKGGDLKLVYSPGSVYLLDRRYHSPQQGYPITFSCQDKGVIRQISGRLYYADAHQPAGVYLDRHNVRHGFGLAHLNVSYTFDSDGQPGKGKAHVVDASTLLLYTQQAPLCEQSASQRLMQRVKSLFK